MRTLILTAFLLAQAFTLSAQDVTIKLKSGERRDVRATANTSDQLLTNGGNFNYSSIDSLTFHGYKDSYDGLKSRLLEHGVKISVTHERKVPSPIVIVPEKRSMNETPEVDFARFIAQRNGGKLLQLAGVAALGVSSYLTIKYSTENAKRSNNTDAIKEVPKFLPWAALGAMGLGIVIDMDAAKHLRKRRR